MRTMRAAVLAFFLVLGVCAVSVAATRSYGAAHSWAEKKSDQFCWSYDDEDSCLDSDCSWCKTTLLGATCVTPAIARLAPRALANCNNPPSDDDVAVVVAADPKKPTSCNDNDNKDDCLDVGAEEGQCAWCKGDFMPPSCIAVSAAKYLPETVAKCKMPPTAESAYLIVSADDDDDEQDEQEEQNRWLQGTHGKKHDKKDKKHHKKEDDTPATCMDNKEKHDCRELGSKEGDCAWCEGSFMPGSCLPEMVAKYLPSMVAECKMSKKKHHKDEDEGVTASTGNKGGKKKEKAPQSCGDNKEKDDCLDLGAQEGDCAWCEGDYMPGSCVSDFAAKWIPETVAKCKLPKKKAAAAVVVVVRDDPAPSGGGDDPKPKPKAVSCGDNDNKDDCLELGAEEGQCAWCKGDYMPPSCVGIKAAEWIPETVAKCKLPANKEQVVVATS